MQTVSFTDFRRDASSWFDQVEKGETLRVFRHGKAIADIAPASGEESTPSWKSPGPRLAVKGASLSEAILDERESGR